MPVNLDQRQFFAKPIALAFVRAEVDRLLVDERVIEAIEFLLDRFADGAQQCKVALVAVEGSPGVRYWSAEECFAIVGEARKLSYPSLRRKSRISVVSQFSKTAQDGRVFEWRRHMAFRGQFRPFDGQWYLEITPTYRFTRDGFELDRFHEDRLKGIKQLEGNRAVLSCILFWADYLRPKRNLFEQDAPPLRFGDLAMFECPVGIDDTRWLSDDPEFGQEAARQRDALSLPDIDDLFNS